MCSYADSSNFGEFTWQYLQSARKPLKPTWPSPLRSKVQKWADVNCKLIDASTVSAQ
jgi:hypothetical protein